MTSLEKKSKKCNWLPLFLKEKLSKGDLRTYNMAKAVIYYFPQILDGVSKENFELAMKHYKDTYICLGQEDLQYRYKVFDDMYRQKHGREFEPSQYGEARYLTIGDLCEHFKI
jgi:hypothetical protein